ncbi:MAG: AmmeMemoRadiSam system radical SAM enzyme, partial [Candidatus Omnitrophota bacterium]
MKNIRIITLLLNALYLLLATNLVAAESREGDIEALTGATKPYSASSKVEPAAKTPARYWKPLENKLVQCLLCPRTCTIPPGKTGVCGVRKNIDGTLYTLVYGLPCAVHMDPIEKKPMFHMLPGTQILSIATAGCNLRCIFCQNWEISQALPQETQNVDLPPQDVIALAKKYNSPSVAFTYTEPTVFFEYMIDTAKLAKENGIKTVMHSCGYINEEPLRELCKYLDGANVDLKGFSDEFYKKIGNGKLEPVLNSLKTLKRQGVWLEITNLIMPAMNDDPKMIRSMCKWIVENLGPDVPLHFSRFYPAHKLTNLAATPIKTLEDAQKIAKQEGLKYVYIGNVPGHSGENTYCPRCYRLLIERVGYFVKENNIVYGKC